MGIFSVYIVNQNFDDKLLVTAYLASLIVNLLFFFVWQVYKSTADYESGKALYGRYSVVDEEFLSLRKTVLARKTPRRMFVQCHTSVDGKTRLYVP